MDVNNPSHKIYSIRDTKGQCFGPIWIKRSHGEAERDFQRVAKDPQSLVAMYPEDFDLYYMGQYDDKSGLLFPLKTPEHLVKAISMISPEERVPVQRGSNVSELNGAGKVTTQQ